MQIDVALILDAYKDEIMKLMNENILLRAQVKQLQNDLEACNKEVQE